MELDPTSAIQRLEGAIYGFKDSISGRFDDISTRITRLESASEMRKEHDAHMERIINGIFERAERDTKIRFEKLEMRLEELHNAHLAGKGKESANALWGGILGGAVSTVILGLIVTYLSKFIAP